MFSLSQTITPIISIFILLLASTKVVPRKIGSRITGPQRITSREINVLKSRPNFPFFFVFNSQVLYQITKFTWLSKYNIQKTNRNTSNNLASQAANIKYMN